MSSTGSRAAVVSRGRLEPAFAVQLVALTPLWLLLVVSTVAAGSLPALDGTAAGGAGIAGVPYGTALNALAMGWTLPGLVAVAKVRSSLGQSIAVLVFTIPATILVVLAPAWSLLVRTAG
jgi:hypothetical protein